MLTISDDELINRMRFDNPWWGSGSIPDDVSAYPERDYFAPFFDLVGERQLRRAVVLMGPRRVGKTIMMQQAIKRLLAANANRQNLLFISLDTPLFSGLPLEKLLQVYLGSYGGTPGDKTIFFDEIQYLKDWEIHLKSLVDSYRDIKFVVSGSAAAALSRGSRESGAGRFTEFLLPPLTFAEFLRLTEHPLATVMEESDLLLRISELNTAFVEYLNYGGYPELALSEEARRNPARYIGQDIVEKVLLRDLPSLYGISDVQELQHLFKVLAFNTGQEISLEGLSQASSVSKNTIRRYIEYLEAAFLVRSVDRIDINAQRFQRNRNFKIYLTNPCLRAALFGPVSEDDDRIGSMAETAIFSQWFHDAKAGDHLRYARDKEGEIDIVSVQFGEPTWVVEIKWTDRFFERPSELGYLRKFVAKHARTLALPTSSPNVVITTRRKTGDVTFDLVPMHFEPTALHCLKIGRSAVRLAGWEVEHSLFLPVTPENNGQT